MKTLTCRVCKRVMRRFWTRPTDELHICLFCGHSTFEGKSETDAQKRHFKKLPASIRQFRGYAQKVSRP